MTATPAEEHLTAAKTAADRLTTLAVERGKVTAERDSALVRARRENATWKQMQKAGNLTARGLSLALERGGA